MAHDDHSTGFEELLQLLSEHGFDGMAEAIEILMNEAMKLQRADALGAMPYQRSESRRGYANGFKPKTVNSRLGRLNLKVPQTRDVEFYPSALERGERSERALKLAVAEMMYVQGVSTRKVAEITKEPCGLDGNQRPRRPHGFRVARDPSAPPAHHQLAGTAQSRDQTSDSRGNVVPQ